MKAEIFGERDGRELGADPGSTGEPTMGGLKGGRAGRDMVAGRRGVGYPTEVTGT